MLVIVQIYREFTGLNLASILYSSILRKCMNFCMKGKLINFGEYVFAVMCLSRLFII